MGGEVLADGVAGVVADDGYGPAALMRRGDEAGGSRGRLCRGHGQRFEAGQLALRQFGNTGAGPGGGTEYLQWVVLGLDFGRQGDACGWSSWRS